MPAVLWEHPVFPGDTQCAFCRHLLTITILLGTGLFCDTDLWAGFLELPLVKRELPEIPPVFFFHPPSHWCCYFMTSYINSERTITQTVKHFL